MLRPRYDNCHDQRYDSAAYSTPNCGVCFEFGDLQTQLDVSFTHFFEILIDTLDLQQDVLPPLRPTVVVSFACHNTIVRDDDI